MQENENKEKAKKSVKKKPLAPNKLKMLITVVGRKKTEFYEDIIQGFDCNFQTVISGRGTAGAELLNMLGLSDTGKSVIFSIVREDRIKDLLSLLSEKFATVNDGKGIAFTVPLTGTIGLTAYKFLSNMRTSEVKDGI